MPVIIEPFTLLLAFLPLVAYLLVFSAIRLSGRVLVTTGARDTAALAFAISGLLAVGPAELFFPSTAAVVFGPWVWVAIAAFYGLSVALIALGMAPRLVVYGRSPNEMYEPLMAAVRRLDPQAVGDAQKLQVALPSLGIRLRLDGQRLSDHAQVLSFDPRVGIEFWGQLLSELRDETARLPTPGVRRGFAMLAAACLIGALLVWHSLGNQALVMEGFRDWLWR